MQTSFDTFGLPEMPYIILCNPDKTELYSLALAYDTKLTERLNALSEFEFIYPKSIDGGITDVEGYNYVQNKRLILLEGYGYFQIVDAVEDLNGAVPLKTVSCKSAENELTAKRVSAYTGTIKLYDLESPAGTILADMISLAPNWSVGNVDAELTINKRTFNISDSNVYKFLVDDVSKAFECIFFFDTVNRTISAKVIANVTTPTDIYLSFDNVIKTASFAERSDEITTCLSVYGGGNLTIRGVNPLGTERIYNFDYYATTEWMSASLVDAIASWKLVVSDNEAIYASNLLTLKEEKAALIVLEGDLANLRAEYAALQSVLAVKIQDGLDTTQTLYEMSLKENEIAGKTSDITAKNAQIDEITAVLADITTTVGFLNNFTPTQLLELNNFIYENTYKNDNIIQTDAMTLVEIQEMQEALYAQGISVLGRLSQPRYEFDLESANYLNIAEFSVFTAATELGTTATIELGDGTTVVSALLEISLNFYDPTDFKLKFSNRLRLDGGNFVYSDLLGSIVSTGANVSFNAEAWSNWEDEYKNPVSDFINSALNAANNEIISSTDQEIVINAAGLKGRKKLEGGTYSPKEIWLTSSILAFTDDNWANAKLALGTIKTPSGVPAYGLVADYIVGKIIAGNSLTISNETSTFTVDGDRATLTNAIFTVTKPNNSRIIINPTQGFAIQQWYNSTWTDRVFMKSDGNVRFSGELFAASGDFAGKITANEGSIGGWIITSAGIARGSNYIRSNGDIKLGLLSINTAEGTASFSGDVYAQKIFGEIQNSQVGSGLDASKVTFGTLGANVITSGEIHWGGDVRMYPRTDIYGRGYAVIETPQLQIVSGDIFNYPRCAIVFDGTLNGNTEGSLFIQVNKDDGSGGSYISMDIANVSITSGNTLYLEADRLVSRDRSGNSGWAETTTLTVGTYNLQFINGILVGH